MLMNFISMSSNQNNNSNNKKHALKNVYETS